MKTAKERPILFSGAMVKALLDGTKTQTRRIVKPWSSSASNAPVPADLAYLPDFTSYRTTCPYGQPGDWLWVRETWGYRCSETIGKRDSYVWGHTIEYAADGARRIIESPESDPAGLPRQRSPRDGEDRLSYEAYLWAYWRANRPSIHMPRWASRITLEVTGVRVERLQDISEADAIAEGTTPSIVGADLDHLRYRAGYQTLWESINGVGSWDANPWVWVIEFKRVESQVLAQAA